MSDADPQLTGQRAPVVIDSPFDSLYQGIQCGSLRLAVSYRWARSILESFDETPVPKAPLWLAGATAVDGQVRPIIDIALLIDPAFVRDTPRQSMHLLLGGADGGDLRDPPMALLFDGMPQQLRDEGLTSLEQFTIPDALAPFVELTVSSPRGETYYVIDIAKLADRLASELSTL